MEDNSSYLVVGSIDGKFLLRADPVAMWDVAGFGQVSPGIEGLVEPH